MSTPIKRFLRFPYNSSSMGELAIAAAQRLKEAREAAGLTQADVADQLRLSRDAISKIENGRSVITLKHLEALPQILYKPISYFLGLDSNLSFDEEELLTLYRSLPSTGPTRRFARAQLQAMVESVRLLIVEENEQYKRRDNDEIKKEYTINSDEIERLERALANLNSEEREVVLNEIALRHAARQAAKKKKPGTPPSG